MKKNSLQFELSLKISLFFILFILGFGSGIIIYMSNQYNEIIMENINTNIENMVEAVDYYFEDVKTPMVMMARNDNILRAIKRYQNMTNSEKLETINALDDFVQNITSFKSFINDIIIVGSNGYTYNIYNSNQNKYLNDFDFINSVYIKEAKEGEVKLYYLGQHIAEYYIRPDTDGGVYSVVLPIRNGKNKAGYIICDVKAAVINQILENNLKENKAKILILDEKDSVIFAQGNEMIGHKEILDAASVGSTHKSKNIFEILFVRDNYIAQVKSKTTGWCFYYAEPFANFNGVIKQMFFFNVGIISVGLLVIIFFSKQLSGQVLKPLKNIAYMIHQMKINQGAKKEQAFYLKGQNANELSIEIEYMIQKMDHLINDNYVYELKAKDARIEVLINQLSPHFLYNTLQLIEYQSYADNKENVTKIIGGLSYILRYSISNNKMVELVEELHYIEYYLQIYSLRYQEKLTYTIDAEMGSEKAIIPKMVMEPLVSNCLKHGFSGVFHHAKIVVKTHREAGILFITVEDNGKGIENAALLLLQDRLEHPEVLQEHIGLNNVNAILRLRYGEPYGASVESKLGEYTKVTLRLPFVESEKWKK